MNLDRQLSHAYLVRSRSDSLNLDYDRTVTHEHVQPDC